jgi:predicted Ser/Thr protein kinase
MIDFNRASMVANSHNHTKQRPGLSEVEKKRRRSAPAVDPAIFA